MFDQWAQSFDSNPMQAFHMLNANVPFMMGNMPKINQFLQGKGFKDFGDWRNSLDSASSSAYRPISADPNQQQAIANFGKTPYHFATNAPVPNRTGGLDPNLNGHHGPGSGLAGTMSGSGSGYAGPMPSGGKPMLKGPSGHIDRGAGTPFSFGSMGLPTAYGGTQNPHWMPAASQNFHSGGWMGGWNRMGYNTAGVPGSLPRPGGPAVGGASYNPGGPASPRPAPIAAPHETAIRYAKPPGMIKRGGY
jgi:hypothetical protein